MCHRKKIYIVIGVTQLLKETNMETITAVLHSASLSEFIETHQPRKMKHPSNYSCNLEGISPLSGPEFWSRIACIMHNLIPANLLFLIWEISTHKSCLNMFS